MLDYHDKDGDVDDPEAQQFIHGALEKAFREAYEIFERVMLCLGRLRQTTCEMQPL